MFIHPWIKARAMQPVVYLSYGRGIYLGMRQENVQPAASAVARCHMRSAVANRSRKMRMPRRGAENVPQSFENDKKCDRIIVLSLVIVKIKSRVLNRFGGTEAKRKLMLA